MSQKHVQVDRKIKQLLSRPTGAHRLGTVVRVFEIRRDSKSGLSLASVVLRSVLSLTEFARNVEDVDGLMISPDGNAVY